VSGRAATGWLTPSAPGMDAGRAGLRRPLEAGERGTASTPRIGSVIINVSCAVKLLKHRRLSWQSAIYARTQAFLVPALAFPGLSRLSPGMVRALCFAILAGLAANAAERAEIGQVMPEWELANWINRVGGNRRLPS